MCHPLYMWLQVIGIGETFQLANSGDRFSEHLATLLLLSEPGVITVYSFLVISPKYYLRPNIQNLHEHLVMPKSVNSVHVLSSQNSCPAAIYIPSAC